MSAPQTVVVWGCHLAEHPPPVAHAPLTHTNTHAHARAPPSPLRYWAAPSRKYSRTWLRGRDKNSEPRRPGDSFVYELAETAAPTASPTAAPPGQGGSSSVSVSHGTRSLVAAAGQHRNCSWGACSKSCGTGYQLAADPAHPTCHGKLIRRCAEKPCPIDCVVSAHGNLTGCDKTCGGGTRLQGRSIHVPSAFGGKACPALMRKLHCNAQPCPVDCTVSLFAPWSICTQSCQSGSDSDSGSGLEGLEGLAQGAAHEPDEGHGVQVRKRSVVAQARLGGRGCPHLAEDRRCHWSRCPVDCAQGALSEPAWEPPGPASAQGGSQACQDWRAGGGTCAAMSGATGTAAVQVHVVGRRAHDAADSAAAVELVHGCCVHVRRRKLITDAAYGGKACLPEVVPVA